MTTIKNDGMIRLLDKELKEQESELLTMIEHEKLWLSKELKKY